MDAVQVAYVVGTPLFVVHAICAGALYVARRHLFPIRGRSVPLVILSVIGIVIVYCTLPLPQVFGVPECSGYQLSFGALVLSFAPFFARIWRLWFLYFASREKLEQQSEWPSDFRELEPRGNGDDNEESDTLPSDSKRPVIAKAVEAKRSSGSESTTLGTTQSDREESQSALRVDARHCSAGDYLSELQQTSGWFVAHRHWVRNSTLISFVVAQTLLFSLAIAVLHFAFGGSDEATTVFFPGVDGCPSVQAVLLVTVIYGGLTLFLIVVTTYRLRLVRDAYRIKFELKMTLLGGIVTIVVSEPLRYSYPRIGEVTEVFTGHILLASLLTYPVIMSFLDQKKSLSSGDRTRVPPLLEILTYESHTPLRHSFKEQLVEEFCVENYLFFFAARGFERWAARTLSLEASHDSEGEGSERVAQAAMQLYHEYIIEFAPNQINVAGVNRTNLERRLREHISNFDDLNAEFLANQPSHFWPFVHHSYSKSSSALSWRKDIVAATLVDEESGAAELASREVDFSNARLPVAIERGESLSVDVFSEVRDEIFDLMNNDSYMKWKKKYRRQSV